jgi:colanic acid biosynthesis glycosyl transferase WcaI
MVDWLVSKNIKCTVITAYPYYPYWEIQKPYKGFLYKKEVLNDGLLTIYRCPLYVPKKVNGLKRILHEGSFLLSSFFVIFMLLFKKKIKYIYCIAPPFHLGLPALFYKFIKGSFINYHVQDLQIEAASNLKMIKSNWLLNIFSDIEKYILKHVDEISSISIEMNEKLQEKSYRSISFYPNWVDCNKYYPIVDEGKKNRLKWGFKDNQKLILYSGSIGEKQGLNLILYVAGSFKNQKNIVFIIAGSGSYLSKLKKIANVQKIKNIHFLPLQPEEVFNEFLNMVDVHLILQKKKASGLVMPSKLTTILASGGLVLVSTNTNSGLYRIISENNIGLLVEPESINKLIKALNNCLNENHDQIKQNARNYAVNNLERDKLINNIFELS